MSPEFIEVSDYKYWCGAMVWFGVVAVFAVCGGVMVVFRRYNRVHLIVLEEKVLKERVLEERVLEERVLHKRRRATPIQDDPIEQAYEGHVHEEALEAPKDDEEEDEYAEIQEVVGGFPGGPRDASLLTHYVQHVAYAISQGRDQRDLLKLISHGIKVNKLGPCAEGIQHIVLNSSLMPLTQICYDYIDKGFSFHLSVGEMTITLDDETTLLHVLELEFEEARTTLVDLLDIDGGTVGAEMEDARGTKDWDCAARAYLLHLVGCTIFANKSASFIRVFYLLLFRDIHACGRYAWGVAALSHLYEQLGVVSLASTKQMAGYLTLFQSWIYEHFPSMGRRRLVSSYDGTTPRATRWQSPRQMELYDIHMRDIGAFVHYSESRVMRQFRFYQEIPRPPTVVADADVVVVDFAWFHFTDHVIRNVRQTSYPSECVDGYIQWFRRVSHPCIIAAPTDARPTLAPTQQPDVPQEARRQHKILLRSSTVQMLTSY
ncbi:hypothetical protein V8G54_030531 [Vigna mungo]|uniref:Aminotransferase-like plant mobile domain-containing protein n=1 Tax=Vigna mungo TaxID=3915 RepID=A0AAQ3RNQ6_VIGMU